MTSPSTSSSNRLPWRTSVDPGEAEAGQRTVHGLALGVEDLGLGHDVDDDSGHGWLLARGAGAGRAAPPV